MPPPETKPLASERATGELESPSASTRATPSEARQAGAVRTATLDGGDAGPGLALQRASPPRAKTAGENVPEVLPPGTNVGRYVILSQLGGGGMGVVYAAFDPELDRKVALKLLAPSLLDSGRSEEFQARLLREARAMAKVSHPNVIAVHDAGTFHSHVFIAMDLVEGGLTLRHWQKARAYPWREIRDMYLQAGRGLSAAHAAGLIHRDFKPDNVLVGPDEKVYVTDFGLARPAGVAEVEVAVAPVPNRRSDDEERSVSVASPLNLPATEVGAVLGTPGYMAPEQLASATLVEARSDQFAFCAALYEALYGFRPFEGKTVLEFGREVLARRIREPPTDTRVPVRIRRLLLKGLSRRREDRFATMDELLESLGRDPQLTRRRWLIGSAAAVTAVAAAAGTSYGVSIRQSHLCEGAERHWTNVWDGPRQAAIRSTFLASRKPFAQDAWKAVHDSLDGFVNGWVLQHTEACRATRVRGEQSDEVLGLRMLCLERLRIQAETLTRVFATADDAVIEKSVQAVSDLPDVKTCGDLIALASRVKAPDTLAQRQKVAELRDKLSEATALQSIGQEKAAFEIAKSVSVAAQDTHYPPLMSEALTLRGKLEGRQAGDYRQSEQTLWDAVWAAEEGRDDAAAVNAWSELTYLEGNRLSKPEEGLRASRHAESFLHSIGDNPQLKMNLLLNKGGLLMANGTYAEAQKLFEESFGLAKTIYPEDHPARAKALSSVADALMREGNYPRAGEMFQQAFAILERRFGPHHPRITPALTGLGNIALKQGKGADAVSFHSRTLAILEGALHPTHPWLSEATYNLGVAYMVLGDQDKAQRLLRRGLALDELNLGADHPDITVDLGEIAESEIKQKRYPEALGDLHRATAILRLHSKLEDIRDAPLLSLEGQALQAQGNFQRALGYYDRALVIRGKELGPQSSELALDLWRTGDCYLALGKSGLARSHLERALKLWETGNSAPDQLGWIQLSLARALWEDPRQRKVAVALAAKARENFVLEGADAEGDRRTTEAWLLHHPLPR